MQYAELFQDVKVLGNSRKLISQTYTVMGADAFNNQQWDKAIEIFSKGYEANPTDTDLASSWPRAMRLRATTRTV